MEKVVSSGKVKWIISFNGYDWISVDFDIDDIVKIVQDMLDLNFDGYYPDFNNIGHNLSPKLKDNIMRYVIKYVKGWGNWSRDELKDKFGISDDWFKTYYEYLKNILIKD